MKKKQDNETKVYLVYDEELDQFVLKKGDDWGEIPGLFFIEKCSHKTIDFCSYTTYNKDS